MDLETEEQIGLYITFGIYNLFLWPGLLFFILRRNFEPIKSRGFLLSIIQVLLGDILLVFGIIPNSVSCFFRPAALLLIVPFVCIPYVIRGLVLYHRYILHDGMKIWAGRHKSTSLSSVDGDAEMFLKNLSNGTGSKNDSKNGSEHEEHSGGRKEKKKDGKSTLTRKEEAVKMSKRGEGAAEGGEGGGDRAASSNSNPPTPAGAQEDPAALEEKGAAGEEGRTSRNPLFPEETRKKDFGLDLKLDKKFIWAVRNKKWFQDRFLIPINFVIAFPFVAVIILLYFFDTPIYDEAVRNDFSVYVHNRCFTRGFIPYFLVQFAVTSPAISLTGYLLLGVKEAFKMRIELMGVLFCGSLGTMGCLVSIFYPAMPPTLNYLFFATIGTTCLCCWTIIFPVIESYKFQKIERKEKPKSEEEQSSDSHTSDREVSGGARTHESSGGEKKKNRPSRIGDDEILKIIFEEPELLKGFEEFAVSTWCMENVLFYKRVQQFKAIAQDSKLADQGKKIWTYHFERGCDFEVNVDAPVREKIMEMVQQNKYERNMFHDAEKIVFAMLRYNIYPLWKASSSYKSILEKLGSPDVLSVRARRKAAAKKLAEGA